MAYFTNYYTNYFDVEEGVVAAERAGGGLAPSLEEWQEYLRRWHELRRREAAEFAARKGLRALLREELFPSPPPKTVREVVERAVEKARIVERAETRITLRRFEANDIRTEIARLYKDLRKQVRVIKKKKKRDEEALLVLWDG